MAKCDQGYLCRVCGEEVELITDSELYLKYVIGEIDPETLHLTAECHLRCSPALAQFIADERFQLTDDAKSKIPDVFLKSNLDQLYVTERTALVTLGYQRLIEIRSQRRNPIAVIDYPLTSKKP